MPIYTHTGAPSNGLNACPAQAGSFCPANDNDDIPDSCPQGYYCDGGSAQPKRVRVLRGDSVIVAPQHLLAPCAPFSIIAQEALMTSCHAQLLLGVTALLVRYAP